MNRKKPSLNLDRLNERAAAEFIPTTSLVESSSILKSLPLTDILDRPKGDARPLNENHVSDLSESIMVLGLISPLTVDRNNHLLAGGHRRAALLKILIENETRYYELFPDGIPVRVIDIDASNDEIDALQIEVEENTQRRNFTATEIREAALRLEEAGYERLRGRPKAGQRSLKRELATVFKLSEDRIQRILNESEKKGRCAPTFSAETAVTTIERWLSEIGEPVSPSQEKVRRQMQTLIKELGKMTK